jgi:hypothetical protein
LLIIPIIITLKLSSKVTVTSDVTCHVHSITPLGSVMTDS